MRAVPALVPSPTANIWPISGDTTVRSRSSTYRAGGVPGGPLAGRNTATSGLHRSEEFHAEMPPFAGLFSYCHWHGGTA